MTDVELKNQAIGGISSPEFPTPKHSVTSYRAHWFKYGDQRTLFSDTYLYQILKYGKKASPEMRFNFLMVFAFWK